MSTLPRSSRGSGPQLTPEEWQQLVTTYREHQAKGVPEPVVLRGAATAPLMAEFLGDVLGRDLDDQDDDLIYTIGCRPEQAREALRLLAVPHGERLLAAPPPGTMLALVFTSGGGTVGLWVPLDAPPEGPATNLTPFLTAPDN